MTATERALLGMLTPSSNTVLEPLTSAMVAGLPEVSAHFARFPVTEISLGERALDQFEPAALIAAANLLADAKVKVIAWNGTSSGWLGFDRDIELCARLARETGVPATSSVLALNEIFQRTDVTRFALVTPYLDEIQRRIIANYGEAGFACVAERHLDARDNFSFSEISEERIAALVRAVAADKPDAITTFCTNLRGAPVAESLERELGIPVYDTVSAAVWKSLRLAGVDTRRVAGWGRLFSDLS